jgi:hypothetical protein
VSAARQSLDRFRLAGLDGASLHPLERKGYDRLMRDLGQKQLSKE